MPRPSDTTHLPIVIPLLPGLRWIGKLKVESKEDGGYQVQFDAEDPKSTNERFIFDRTVLTPTQVFDWTGVRFQ